MNNEPLGIPKTHPDFIRLRRERFCKLLREGKRILKLSPEERAKVIELCEMIERNKPEAKVKSKKLCQCGNPAERLHTCPYKEDINGDSETKCNCCVTCQNQCAMDI